MAKLRIRPFTLCRVQADKGAMTYLAYYGEKIWRPYIFFVIEGAGQNILVDTAIHAEDYRGYHPGCRNLPFEALKTFEDALSEVSLRPDDIDLVIQTHLHIDHCFNTPKCKNATILVQEDEFRYSKAPHPVFAWLYQESILQGLRVETLHGREEIVPGIEVIPVPGHTPGCQAVSVDTEAGKAVISGCCCIKENFFPAEDIQERVSPFAGYPVIIPGIQSDAPSAYDSMLLIKALADIVIPMHEPELMGIETIP